MIREDQRFKKFSPWFHTHKNQYRVYDMPSGFGVVYNIWQPMDGCLYSSEIALSAFFYNIGILMYLKGVAGVFAA